MLFMAATVPYKDKEEKKWYAQTIDGQLSKMWFSTKRDTLLYIKDTQHDLYIQLQNVLETANKDNGNKIHFQERSMYSYWVSLTSAYGPREAEVVAEHLKERGVPVRKKKNGTIEARKYEYSDIDSINILNAVNDSLEKHSAQEKNWRPKPEFILKDTYTMKNGSSVCLFRCVRDCEQEVMSERLRDTGYNIEFFKPGFIMVWKT